MTASNVESKADTGTQLKIIPRRNEFLSRYKLDNRAMQRGDAKTGRPKIIGAANKETGERVVIKHWKRDSVITEDALKEIWRQEVRQLHRLAGWPGARDFMVSQSDSGEDLEGFYLVLSPDQRLPVQALLARVTEFHWLRQPRVHANRQKIWVNLQRIANGLDILHTQGMLHRNLDTLAIFGSGSDEPDFQLSGFEWSVRLAGVANPSPIRIRKFASEDTAVYSFLEDWRAYGRLASDLLGIDWNSLIRWKRREDLPDPAPHISPLERELLLLLLRPDPITRLDGDLVSEKIDHIVQSLRTLSSGRLSTLHITCNLAGTMRLATAIYDAMSGEIDIHDLDNLLDFIRQDISEDPILLSVTSSQPGNRFLLAGRSLTYVLNAYRPFNKGEPTWAIAYCEATTQRPAQREIIGQQSLTFAAIELIPLNQVTKRFAALQGRTLHWDQQITKTSSSDTRTPAIRKYHGFLLLQQLEALISAANIFPITVISTEPANDGVKIGIQSREDYQRESLASALELKSPSIRMAEIFADEQISLDGAWKISEEGVLGKNEDETARWRFVETQEHEGANTIFFEGTGPAPISKSLFLRKSDYVGNETLLRRRARSLRALKDHVELLEMLTDPRRQIRKTHDLIEEDAAFKRLDESKQNALREMWAVLPLFLVQGPPGVGKTRLVTELVGRSLRDDTSSRILLTAQSHHAVDHLLEEIKKVIAHNTVTEPPLLIRTRPRDNDSPEDILDIRQQAGLVINRLADSSLVEKAPQQLKNKVLALKKMYANTNTDDQTTNGYRGRDLSFEGLLLRSANVVFASTNSGDLERLIEERAQFDWTIVEEAAKATGTELIAPLLLSHRRVMIGDHNQLPPYGEEHLRKLLLHPNKVREALELARPLISAQLREVTLEDLSNEGTDTVELQTVCGEAAIVLNLFESMVKNEFEGTKPGKSRLPIARRLTYQHRMHPAIARLVSASFYEETLLSDPSSVSRFENNIAPFEISQIDKLPASPIVFINMPYGQGKINFPNGERKPNYHNPDELEAIISALSLIHVRNHIAEKPTLAVLSPYRQQVRRLTTRIKREFSGKLSHIQKFSFEGDAETPVGTVDSFQGSEADIVVLSLVRNNHHSGKRALGFLSDARRMNVLLSRAKWKLIVICSIDFLKKRLPQGEVAKTDDLYFLSKMFQTLAELQNEVDESKTPLASIINVASLNGGQE